MSVIPHVPRDASPPALHRDDAARADAWVRLGQKLDRLARGHHHAFLADLLLVGIERVIDELLGHEDEREGGHS